MIRCCPGSSPLTRGKRVGRAAGHGVEGLIPAHAGKTPLSRSAAMRAPAHPRSRGENYRSCRLSGSGKGSSPLTRGKLHVCNHAPPPLRLIPAHAGKTVTVSTGWEVLRAHPRSRGENQFRMFFPPGTEGSSPLTRGKPEGADGLTLQVGLIPAHAGKTDELHWCHDQARAHPRSRGENGGIQRAVVCKLGSSPLTRGKQGRNRRWKRKLGLIPAHAGKTDRVSLALFHLAAHPRSRGENRGWVCALHMVSGSSPLTRGKRSVYQVLASIERLIPAHAGKTVGGAGECVPSPAHPRSRGENTGWVCPCRWRRGSSPLTRGKRRFPRARAPLCRLIPAHAGKTPSV